MATIGWWNGFSALLDLSQDASRQWLRSVLQGLELDLGVDGFEFDAGVARFAEDEVEALEWIESLKRLQP